MWSRAPSEPALFLSSNSDYSLEEIDGKIVLGPTKLPVGQVVETLSFVLLGLVFCIGSLFVLIDELMVYDSYSECGSSAREFLFEDGTVYCEDVYSESVKKIEVAEHHFKITMSDYSVETRWEFIDASEKYVVYGYMWDEGYDCNSYVNGSENVDFSSPEGIQMSYLYINEPDWCGGPHEGESPIYNDSVSHPFLGVEMYLVPRFTDEQPILSVEKVTSSKLRNSIIETSEWSSRSIVEIIIPPLIGFLVGCYLLMKSDRRQQRIVFDFRNNLIQFWRPTSQRSFMWQDVEQTNLFLTIGEEERTVWHSSGDEYSSGHWETTYHNGLKLILDNNGQNYTLAFFDGETKSSEYVKQFTNILGVQMKEGSSGAPERPVKKQSVTTEVIEYQDEGEEEKLNAFWES